jgi:hypothetical protein
MGEDDKIVKTVEAVEGLVKAVPIYNDAIQPAAKQIGEVFETLAKTIKVAILPLKAIAWGYDRIGDFLQQKLTQKLANVPLDRIKTPSFIVAGPIIEGLQFTSEEETLRELYANLLVTSMDSKTAHNAHPGFVQIIKNMSPDEARIIKFLAAMESQPLIDIFKKNKLTRSWVPLYRNFSFLGRNSKCEFLELVPNYLNNLCRLGLTEIPTNVSLSITENQKKDSLKLNIYDELKKDKEIVEFIQEIDLEEGFIIDFENKVIDLTDLGRQFCSACVIDKNLP